MEIDPKEVLLILNKKGYKNITSEQLKAFMQGQYDFLANCLCRNHDNSLCF